MSEELTREIALDSLNVFFNIKPFALFGTGTSCAIDVGFGMGALEEYLKKDIPPYLYTPAQHQQWDLVTSAISRNLDLESAMNAVQDEDLTKLIIERTACFLANLDREYSIKILSGDKQWPAIRLLKRLMKTCSQSDYILHVATTNYDLLAEYSLENTGIPYTTGFIGGVCRNQDWRQSGYCFKLEKPIKSHTKIKSVSKHKEHINLYKVHGSLNTFALGNNMVENNAWICDPPSQVERIMITPGTAKYQRLHQYRTELLKEYDNAIEKHHSFLFIGFGFNDSQLINNAIKHKLIEQKCPGLIITRGSNPRIEEYLRECENLWLVCKQPGDGKQGTRIFNSRYAGWLDMDDQNLWDAGEFAQVILGG